MPASLAFFLLRFACDFETFSPVSAARMTDCGGAIVAGAGLAVGCSTKLPTIMPGLDFLGFWAARGGGARRCCCCCCSPCAGLAPLAGAPFAFGVATLGAGMFPLRPGIAIAGAPPMPPALGAAAVVGLCC